ncbi:MAG: 3-isopropylmalate dehydrogenase [Bacteroidota bacterium]|nr:3-isopropylmalate dehydrogenase [Bacteroidota bacterium]
MHKNIAVLAGDGIGPEIITEAIKVLQAVTKKYHHSFTYEHALMGAVAIDETGNPLPDKTLEICKSSDAILFGAIGDPKYDNDPNAKVRPEQGLLALRKAFNLFCNVRPVTIYDSLIDSSPLKRNRIEGVDLVIYRELTGGIYFGEKKEMNDKGVASDLCTYSKEEILRVAHLAFKAAGKRKNKLTLVDKANVLASSRLWRSVVTELHSSEYKDVELDFLFVDNAAMQMVLNPAQFDVILTGNLFGDIISDEASVIGGSIGLLASASIGDRYAMFEPIHGSFPQGKGKGIANPTATILSAAMMLDHFEMVDEANAIRDAVQKTIDNNVGTTDIYPDKSFTTSEVGTYISDIISQ